jgi:hypothetical protein
MTLYDELQEWLADYNLSNSGNMFINCFTDADTAQITYGELRKLAEIICKYAPKPVAKSALKPFNSVIQVCPKCRKVDVYLNDGHVCEYNPDQFD